MGEARGGLDLRGGDGTALRVVKQALDETDFALILLVHALHVRKRARRVNSALAVGEAVAVVVAVASSMFCKGKRA